MKYAIAHDFGGEEWSFYGEYIKQEQEGDTSFSFVRTTFETFGEAYVRAIAMGYTEKFEVFGVFDPADISVTVSGNN